MSRYCTACERMRDDQEFYGNHSRCKACTKLYVTIGREETTYYTMTTKVMLSLRARPSTVALIAKDWSITYERAMATVCQLNRDHRIISDDGLWKPVGFYDFLGGTCVACGTKFQRVIFKDRTYQTCGKKGCKVKNNRDLYDYRRELIDVPEGDLEHLAKKRIDRTRCKNPSPFALNWCLDYDKCLEESFANCTGYKQPVSNHISGGIDPRETVEFGRLR